MAYIGPEPNPGQNREVDDISSSFNGSLTDFTLQVNSQNISPGSANSIIVSLGGVVQNPNTDYTINSSTITFSTPPTNGLSFFGLVLGQGVDAVEPADGSVSTVKIADQAVTLAKLPHGTGSNDGKFLRANNGADPTFETVTSTTINNNADNRVITGSGTANTLEAESTVVIDSSGRLGIGNTSPDQKLKIEDSSDVAIHILKTGSQDTLIKNTGQTEICAATGGSSGQRIAFKIGASTGSLSDIAKFTPDGLCFGSDTAAANALDDYEEGTWSPSGSWTTITAVYTKIGRMVHAGFSLRADTSSGDVTIGNLPFTSGSTHAHGGGIAWGLCEFNSSSGWLNGSPGDASTSINVRKNNAVQLTFGSGQNNMNNSAFIRGVVVYMTA